MTEARKSPYAPRVISEGDIPVHRDLGEVAQTCRVGVPRPMPGIVILVHGVNDVGEAYQNQEKGIIAGLSKRLGRTDFYTHEWGDYRITRPGRSPVIPFYWGYKPVTHDDYKADQKRYRDEVGKLKDQAHLPYDAYQEDNPDKKADLGNDGKGAFKYQNDNFGNALDANFAKGGGTFANATTNIPDMLGPGAGGVALAAAGFASLHMNDGDYTHPIYENPHRIYQFFAAQRLADLILQIRTEEATRHDVINIVAHSQGTIITMLANMLVKQAGQNPVNCVILNHSPYSLESRVAENIQPGYTDTQRGIHTEPVSQFYRIFTKKYVHPSERYIALPTWDVSGFLVSKDYGQTWHDALFSPGENDLNGMNAPQQEDVLSFTVVNDQGFLQTKHRLYMSSKPFDDPRILPGGPGIFYSHC